MERAGRMPTRPLRHPTELRYLHRDALGSVNAITDEQGQLVERLAYDPWGKRRYPNGGADPEGPARRA